MKKTILFFALAAVGALSLLSCQSSHQYFKSYSYEAVLGVSYGTSDDIKKVRDDLNAVIGPDATLEKGLYSPADDKMKSGFESVKQKYAGKLEKSAYFTFKLVKTTIDTTPDAPTKVQEELGVYEFGNALQHPYAFYNYASTHKEAMDALRAMKDKLSDEDYQTSGKTLANIENEFKTSFSEYNTHPWLVSDANDEFIKKLGKDIFEKYAENKTAVDYTYEVGRIDLFDSTKATILWKETFKANITE